MKKLLLPLAALAVACALWAYLQHRETLRQAEADAKREVPAPVLQKSQAPALKEIVERYEDGSKKSVARVLESDRQIREGLSVEYYRNGKVRSETNYSNNVPRGRFAFYSEDGSLALEGTLKNGLRDGRFTEWHPDGRVKIECGYKNGLLDGAWNEYYDSDGSPKKLEALYRDGALVGRYVVYRIDGLIKEERNYGQVPQESVSLDGDEPSRKTQSIDNGDAPLSSDGPFSPAQPSKKP